MNNLQNALKAKSLTQILDNLQQIINDSDESKFWSDKIIPFSEAILSILLPLRKQNLLFSPEGEYHNELDIQLFLKWMDFLSLKGLIFIIEQSNQNKKLIRTKISYQQTKNYTPIDIQILAKYLTSYNVDLSKEDLDFPISSYNIHRGIKNIIQSLLLR